MEYSSAQSSPPPPAATPPAEELLKKIQELESGHASLKQEMSKLLTSSTTETMVAGHHQKQRSHFISPQRVPRWRKGGRDANVVVAWKKGSILNFLGKWQGD